MNFFKQTLLIVVSLIFSINTFAQITYTSVATGDWEDASTWDQASVPGASDHVIVAGGHTVTVDGNNTSITNLAINSTAVLNNGNKGLQIDGNLLVNGTYTGSKALEFTGGAGQTIDGVGVIKVDFNINGDAEIISSANLSIITSINIEIDVVVINYGKCTINYNLEGSNSGSTWINDVNSTLQLSNELFPANKGVLNASAVGNTVIYNSEVNFQNIFTPLGNTYYNIEFTGVKEKKAQSDLYILGNLIINGGILDPNDYTLYVSGNWTSFSEFIEGSGLVVFNGTDDQTLVRPGGELFYNCQINKSSGTLLLNDQVTISNSLTMTSGNIDVGSKTITLGIDDANIGSISHTSGNVIGKFERWIVSSASPTAYLFPVGTASDFRPAYPTFLEIQTEGKIAFEFIPENPGNDLDTDPIDDGVDIYNTFVDGYWDLTIDNNFGLHNNHKFDLDLFGTNFIAFTIDAETRLLYRDDSGSPWEAVGTHGTNSAPMVQRTDLGKNQVPGQFSFGDDTQCTPPVTLSITGSIDLCTGASDEIYSVTNNAGSTYEWMIEGGTQTSGTGTNSITVDWGTVGMIGNVTVMEQNSCTYGEAVVLDVNVHSIQASEITGKINIPENTLGENYSVIPNSGYTYSWTITGGTVATGTGTDNITVDWGTAGAGNVSVTSQYAGCSVSPATDLDVNVYIVINSVKTGNWNDAATWDCNCIPDISDNIRIVNPNTVTLDANEEINHFTVDAGATLDMLSKSFTCTGDITVDGTITGTVDIVLNGTGNIDGTGIISAGDIVLEGNRTILSSALLTVSSGDINLNNAGNFMVVNNGQITIANDIVGGTNTEKYWTNAVNSTLNIGGVLLVDGLLIAEAEGNTVNFNGAGDQTIKGPENGYWNLTASNLGVKSLDIINLGSLNVKGNLKIEGSTQLDQAIYINIGGDWINTSTNADPFIEDFFGLGLVTFNGTGDQIITCLNTETFNELTIESTSNTILSAGTSVTVKAETTLDGTLTLKSPAGEGPSASFIDNGTISGSGSMHAERFFSANKFHYVSSPIQAGGNAGSDLFTTHPSGNFNPNFYSYNEGLDIDDEPLTAPFGDFDSNNLVAGWLEAHDGGTTNVEMNVTQGYAFWTDQSQNITYIGDPNTDDKIVSGLSYTDNDPLPGTLPNYYDGWNLVGNPYPSAIDWDLAKVERNNLDDGIYVWDGTQYASYAGGTSGGSGNLTKEIAPMQAFFVHATSDPGSLTFKNTHRVHSSVNYLKSGNKNTDVKPNFVRLKMQANGYSDYTVIYFKSNATDGFDGVFDAFKLYSPSYMPNIPHIYSVTTNDATPLSINVLPENSMDNLIVPLYIKIGKTGTYTISLDEFNFENNHVYFVDTYENNEIYLNTESLGNYSFTCSAGDLSDRFELHFFNNNAPVVQNQIPETEILEDDLLELVISPNAFIELDANDKISGYTARLATGNELPEWLSFNSETATFTGQPENENVGVIVIEIGAYDRMGATDYQQFNLNIINTNDAPYVANKIENQSVKLNRLFTFEIPENVFDDIDINDVLTIYTEELPEWLKYSPDSRTLSGYPEITGNFEIKIFAKDIAGETTSDFFELNVENIDVEFINIYPNPNAGVFTLGINSNVNIEGMYVNITNIAGKRVFSEKITELYQEINIRNQPKGVYFLNLLPADNGVNLKKLSFKIILN